MKLKKYMVYLDDGQACFKVAVPAESVAKAEEYTSGNGEIIAVKDISEDYPISIEKVIDALKQADFGQTEIDLIARTLRDTGLAENMYIF